MWEAIERNKRRSWILIGLLGIILVLLGYLIGAAVHMSTTGPMASGYQQARDALDGDSARNAFIPNEESRRSAVRDIFLGGGSFLNIGGLVGACGAVLVWLIMTLVSLSSGDTILLRSAGAYAIQQEDNPRLWNVVEEMTIASSLGKMPKVYVIDDASPNAFAVGRTPDKAAVAVTTGLLKRLNRDELQGVVAHEIAHVNNLDVRFMTIAAIMVGSIVLMCEVMLRYLWYSGGGRRRSSSRGGGQAQIAIVVVVLLAAILAPVLARLLYFACSRKREYLADACGAQFSRYPPGLASALEKISSAGKPAKEVSRTMAPMYIINPLQGRAAVGMFSTHPPTAKRISILRGMAGSAGFADYEEAYRKVHGDKSQCLDHSTLAKSEHLAAREPSAEPETKKDAVSRAKEVSAMLDHLVQFIPIACVCGVTLKLPMAFNQPSLACPRCGRRHEVPAAKEQTAGDPKTTTSKHLRVKRKGKGWESFKCTCGGVVQISPAFKGARASCRKCGRHVIVE